jgi:hypothetical protein
MNYKLAHLGYGRPCLRVYSLIVTWPTDRRVRAQDRYPQDRYLFSF